MDSKIFNLEMLNLNIEKLFIFKNIIKIINSRCVHE